MSTLTQIRQKLFNIDTLYLGAAVFLLHEFLPGPGILADILSFIPGVGHTVTVGESIIVAIISSVLVPVLMH